MDPNSRETGPGTSPNRGLPEAVALSMSQCQKTDARYSYGWTSVCPSVRPLPELTARVDG